MLVSHCYGHARNLAINDAVKNIRNVYDAFEVANEVCKLIKKSLRRNTDFNKIRNEMKNDTKIIHNICPARRTVRGESLEDCINNHLELELKFGSGHQIT